MILPLRHWPDPVLLKPTKPWKWDSGTEKVLAKCLQDTLLSANALGLAANQIGEPYRVMAINSKKFDDITVMFNPQIIERNAQQIVSIEGCLSFPSIELEIPRSTEVTVQWQDQWGYIHSCIYVGIDARCIQHEIDHLDGIVFKDHVSDLKFRRAQRVANKR
jgi:peptide deformylase